MISSFPLQQTAPTVRAQSRRAIMIWWLWFAGVIGATGVIGLQLFRSTPSFATVAWLLVLAGVFAIFYQPRYGVYLIVSFSLAGDSVLNAWYPFVKNLSSAESLLYLGRATSFSPAEIFIALTFISWLGRALILRKLTWYAGPLFLPALLFTGAVTFGLLYGILNHANMNIALWEVRSIYYLPI